MPTPQERLTAALAGRYAIERELGAGGMATVYLAEDVKHRRKVAVKVLRPELAATLGPERFSREIEIAAQLQHPHILPLLDSGEADGFLYYVMPYVEGESLRERLARHGELPIPEATRILVEVVDALAHAHRRGVVHRDIKPDNVMLSERHALVADFGVAKAVSEATGRQKMTTAGVALGTPSYMAPEQAAADPNVDHRADIYAVGAMAYELLAGRPPFTGMTNQEILAAHVTQRAEAVTTRRPAVPPALGAVVMKCLEKRPADRWQTADELLAQLEPLATPSGGMTPSQTQPTSAIRLEDSWRGHPIRVGGLFLLVSMAVLGLVYFLTIQLGLPDWVPVGALVLLLLGLPIMIATGLIERRRAVAQATGMYTSVSETPLQKQVTWRKATMGGVVAFSVLTFGAIVYTAMRLLGIGPVGTLVASGKLSTRDKLIIADFANHTSDSTLGQSVTEAFRIDIAQSPVITVVGSSAVSNALVRMHQNPAQALDATTAREVAVREGAKAVVVGEISPIGKGLVLSAKVLASVDGTELVAVRETAADESEILKAIDRLSKRVRERIGESLRSIRANEPLDEVTTGSLEALRLYSEGARASDAGETDRAIPLLQQAIALDTGFAMAWRKLAVAIANSQGSRAPGDRRRDQGVRAPRPADRGRALPDHGLLLLHRRLRSRQGDQRLPRDPGAQARRSDRPQQPVDRPEPAPPMGGGGADRAEMDRWRGQWQHLHPAGAGPTGPGQDTGGARLPGRIRPARHRQRPGPCTAGTLLHLHPQLRQRARRNPAGGAAFARSLGPDSHGQRRVGHRPDPGPAGRGPAAAAGVHGGGRAARPAPELPERRRRPGQHSIDVPAQPGRGGPDSRCGPGPSSADLDGGARPALPGPDHFILPWRGSPPGRGSCSTSTTRRCLR